MRQLPFFSAMVPLLLLLPGCISSSIGSDLDTVRELSHASILPKVAETSVPASTSKEALDLLNQGPLESDTAVRIAFINNRELRAQLRELGISRGKLVQAGVLPNPLFEAELSPERQSNIELRVEYDISSLILAPLRAKAAEAELDSERYRASGAVLRLGYEVRCAFFHLQASEQRLMLAEQSLSAFAAARDAAQALLDAGNINDLDAALQIAAYERARLNVAELSLDVQHQREKLMVLMGLGGSERPFRTRTFLSPATATLPSFDKLEGRVIESSIDLKTARSRLEAVARKHGVAKTEGLLPDIALDMHMLYGTPEESPGGVPEPSSFRIGGGISLQVPIFDRKQGTQTAYEAEFSAMLERYQGTALELRSIARKVRNQLISAHGRALHYQNVLLPAQKNILRQSVLQYNAMQIGVFQLLKAKRDQLDTEMAYIDTLREYHCTAAALDVLLLGAKVMPGEAASQTVMKADMESGGGH